MKKICSAALILCISSGSIFYQSSEAGSAAEGGDASPSENVAGPVSSDPSAGSSGPDVLHNFLNGKKFFSDGGFTEYPFIRGGASGIDSDREHEFRYMVFLSYSIPELNRREIYRELCGAADTVILYRGLPAADPGTGLFSHLRAMQNEAFSLCGSGLNIRIDPGMFKKMNIDAVPCIVAENRRGRLTKYSGASLPWHLDIHEADPASENSSEASVAESPVRYGPLYEITEKSLSESLAEQFALLDWKKIRENAAGRFLDRILGYSLPSHLSEISVSDKNLKRKVDLSITLQSDLADHEGRVIHPAGTRVDPLQFISFNRFVFVFNPDDGAEAEAVNEYIREHSVPPEVTVRIITRIGGREGWKNLGRMRSANARIYLLDQNFAKRFSVASTPSVIYQDGDEVVIEKLGIPGSGK
jgi:conjugal transfer pilus assembly protein TraW